MHGLRADIQGTRSNPTGGVLVNRQNITPSQVGLGFLVAIAVALLSVATRSDQRRCTRDCLLAIALADFASTCLRQHGPSLLVVRQLRPTHLRRGVQATMLSV